MNFCRVDQMLHVTPAMQAEIADHFWTTFSAEKHGDILLNTRKILVDLCS
jgi:hypothetical protein